MTKIRTVVVDDEPVARERIVGLLNQEKDIEVVGEYSDGTQAVSAIQQQHPDLVFLDVQDNGVGLSAARLTDFNRGVGLSNTRSRLDHLYGSLHRFEFRQPAEGGLLICIAIPMAELASGMEEEQAVEVA